MRFFGLLDLELEEVIEFRLTREEVEAELAGILGDEPAWAGRFETVIVDFSGQEPVVRELRQPGKSP